MPFKRKHHQLIEEILENLDSALLSKNACYFGGDTALCLLHNEYRESIDIDFLVSEIEGYRTLRALLTGKEGFGALAKSGANIRQSVELRSDRDAIRGKLDVAGVPIKIEIVLEARIKFDIPAVSDLICGITTLSELDLATEKLLANSDRGLDPAIFSRDIIDLAMMNLESNTVKRAIAKAETAYGASIKRDLEKSANRVLNNGGWIERCIDAMSVSVSKAEIFKRVLKLGRSAGIVFKLGSPQIPRL